MIVIFLGFGCGCGEIGHEAVLMRGCDGPGAGLQWKTGISS